ncbi:unnamed protein product [Gongylonema pulchrum]|uniref:BTB domain-containing protein n=1 Tax=Gongylonema pulchrum TaxID=637853 RepID=A0A183DN85_9BILA|nr:unnamed protein product [Gongylonema pulchrum]
MFASLRRAQCRRWDDFELKKRLRQFLAVPRRVTLSALALFVFLYFFISSFTSSPPPSATQKCLDERLSAWRSFESDSVVAVSMQKLGFTGNGFIGLGGDGELRMKVSSSRVLSMRGAFYPFIDATVEDSSGSFAETHITDYRVGTIVTIRCFSIVRWLCSDFCFLLILAYQFCVMRDQKSSVCVLHEDYMLIEGDLMFWCKSFGPTTHCVTSPSLYSRLFESDGVRTLAAATCTKVPQSITIKRNSDIILHFLCVINYVSPLPDVKNVDNELKILNDAVTKELTECSSVDAMVLDREQSTAWQRLNLVTFGISKSLAPNALNADEINATRYMLLSNMRDQLLEIGSTDEQRKAVMTLLNKTDMCYTGHSTLLVPSRLWRKWNNMNEVIETMDIWLLTLEKRGCSNLLKAGASGFAEAFVLSLLASKFSREHLEVDIDPADLQREIFVQNLAYSPMARITLSTHLNVDNRPYLMVSSDSQIFACDAACLDHPLNVGRSKIRIPIKVTKPSTPILYVSHNRKHLEQLRGTIHVVEVMDAPAHEHGLIALHRHGHRLGGLPVMFWLMLGALVVVFHLFLFKLVYSEWKKGDTTPYNYYLRQRYLRAH